MLRVLVTLLALMAISPAAAGATTLTEREQFEYGLDAYLDCVAAAGPGVIGELTDHVVCAEELAMDLTDGGQVRRLPLCIRNRTLEFANGENNDPYRALISCVEQYLGTHITTVLPHFSLPPAQ